MHKCDVGTGTVLHNRASLRAPAATGKRGGIGNCDAQCCGFCAHAISAKGTGPTAVRRKGTAPNAARDIASHTGKARFRHCIALLALYANVSIEC